MYTQEHQVLHTQTQACSLRLDTWPSCELGAQLLISYKQEIGSNASDLAESFQVTKLRWVLRGHPTKARGGGEGQGYGWKSSA